MSQSQTNSETFRRELTRLLENSNKTLAFTGAGVSTLCGIPDFRGTHGMYQSQPDAERIFDLTWFHRDPSLYYRGCRDLIYGTSQIEPGPLHLALARLEEVGRLEAVITQNIDMLHQRAGSGTVIELHGSGRIHRCIRCGHQLGFDAILKMLETVEVPLCACGAPYKPDITFFGESLPEDAFRDAFDLASECDLMLVLGTSLTVHPAASVPAIAKRHGAAIVIVNAQPTPLDSECNLRWYDLAEFAEFLMAIIETNKWATART